MTKTAKVIIVLSIALLLVSILAICLGSVIITVSDIFQALFLKEANRSISRNTSYIIRSLRLPRIVTALLSGSALALCGLVFQSVFRNPMADSYILGVSSGSSFAVGLAFVLGAGSWDLALPPVAFVGAMTTTLLLFAISRRNPFSMLLSGIALNFLLSALTTLTVTMARKKAENIIFWSLGSLGNTSWNKVLVLLLILLVSTIVLCRYHNAMDLMLLDDSSAISSGLNIRTTRIVLLLLTSVLTATVVSFCGLIGFVGLMSPHFARLLVGAKHKRLLPVSMIIGALIMLVSDMIARTIVAPSELPIGIVTSILGAPVFLMLLRRKNNAK